MRSRQPLREKQRPAAPQRWRESFGKATNIGRLKPQTKWNAVGISGAFWESYNANYSAGWRDGGFRTCGRALALCRSAGYKRRKKRRGKESFERLLRPGPLPVLQFSGHPLGEAAAGQADQEEHAHAERDHQQDVVLGWGGHHLYGQV